MKIVSRYLNSDTLFSVKHLNANLDLLRETKFLMVLFIDTAA